MTLACEAFARFPFEALPRVWGTSAWTSSSAGAGVDSRDRTFSPAVFVSEPEPLPRGEVSKRVVDRRRAAMVVSAAGVLPWFEDAGDER